MKILAIDFGVRYLGLAIAETKTKIAFPYQVIDNQKKAILPALLEIINQEKIDKIIVGRPISLEGKITQQTKITDEFIDFLKNNLSIPVEFFDERLSSKAVEIPIKKQKNKKLQKNNNHAEAAALILQRYLEKFNL
jgi:putative Holliday junction resolvase